MAKQTKAKTPVEKPATEETKKPAVAKKTETVKKPEAKAPVQKPEENKGLSYAEAEKLMLKGELIKLPEWEGFWFGNIKTGKVFVFTKEGKILDNPETKYKERNDWVVVDEVDQETTEKLSAFHQDLEDREVNSIDLHKSLDKMLEDVKSGKKVKIKGEKDVYFIFENGRLCRYHDNGTYLDSAPLYVYQDKEFSLVK